MSTTEFEESPIDRLYRAGPGALSDFELVSLLTGSLDSAREIVREGLPSIARTDWTTRRGLPNRSAARLSASLELGRRLAAPSPDEREPISAGESIASRLMLRYGNLPQEHLGAIYMDSRHRLLTERVIFVGTINSALVSTRDVLKFASMSRRQRSSRFTITHPETLLPRQRIWSLPASSLKRARYSPLTSSIT